MPIWNIDPQEYNTFLKPILNGFADVVYGSRFTGGNGHRILFFWHSIGNAVLTFCSNMFSNLNLTDMETGYKLFRTSGGVFAFKAKSASGAQIFITTSTLAKGCTVDVLGFKSTVSLPASTFYYTTYTTSVYYSTNSNAANCFPAKVFLTSFE
jgi:hypothetical protein